MGVIAKRITGIGGPLVFGLGLAVLLPKYQEAHTILTPLVDKTADLNDDGEISSGEREVVYMQVGRNRTHYIPRDNWDLTLGQKIDYLELMGVDHKISIPRWLTN